MRKLHKKEKPSYRTILDCPVCKYTIDVISHDDKELGGMGEALLGGDARRQHAIDGPDCTKHKDWILGWVTRPAMKCTYHEKYPEETSVVSIIKEINEYGYTVAIISIPGSNKLSLTIESDKSINHIWVTEDDDIGLKKMLYRTFQSLGESK